MHRPGALPRRAMCEGFLGRRLPAPNLDDAMKSVQTVFNLCLAFALIGIALTVMLFSSGSTGPTVFQRILAFSIVGLLPISLITDSSAANFKIRQCPSRKSNIDSIYYLGFLITLTTLLVSVISYGIVGFGNGKNASDTVIFIATGFGLSLLATAVALWGRVDLVQRREERLRSQDPEEADGQQPVPTRGASPGGFRSCTKHLHVSTRAWGNEQVVGPRRFRDDRRDADLLGQVRARGV